MSCIGRTSNMPCSGEAQCSTREHNRTDAQIPVTPVQSIGEVGIMLAQNRPLGLACSSQPPPLPCHPLPCSLPRHPS